MNSGVRATVVGCALFIAIVMGMFTYNISRDRGLGDDELQQLGVILLPRPRAIAPFALAGADGKPFTNQNLAGHWSLLYFGYTSCPDACPTTLADLAKALPAITRGLTEKGIDTPLQFVFVSVDPERDTPAKIGGYARAFAPSFGAATGSLEALAAFAIQLNVTFGKIPGATPQSYDVDHPVNLVLINPRGHYHGFLRPPFTTERLSVGLPGSFARF